MNASKSSQHRQAAFQLTSDSLKCGFVTGCRKALRSCLWLDWMPILFAATNDCLDTKLDIATCVNSELA